MISKNNESRTQKTYAKSTLKSDRFMENRMQFFIYSKINAATKKIFTKSELNLEINTKKKNWEIKNK